MCPQCGAKVPLPLAAYIIGAPLMLGCLCLILLALGSCLILAAR
jgi:hypothetical protein